MLLNKKALEELRNIINGDGTPDYRRGLDLVNFFNQLGFHDVYGPGFPSRWIYTDEKLNAINGTPELDKCIRNIFAVVNYVDRIDQLDELISRFNKYLAFDKWQVIRDNDQITFKRLDKVIIEDTARKAEDIQEEEFLKYTFTVDVDSMRLDADLSGIIKERLSEVEKCVSSGAALASVFMIGSIMEGILLGIAAQYPRQFNVSPCSPREQDGKVRKLPDWTLNNFIDVAADIGILKQDVKKFSHVVRDFRNYIHPHSQMVTHFSPDKQTALICFQVLKAAIFQISDYQKSIQGGTH